MILHAAPDGPLDTMIQPINAARGTQNGGRMAVFVDGNEVPAGARVKGHAAAIFKTNDKTLPDALSRVDVAYLHLYECRATDVSALADQHRLIGLSLEWMSKVTTLEWVAGLKNLTALSLVNLSKLSDLGPLASLGGLRGLAISGSMTSSMRLASFAPIANLHALEELNLIATRVDDANGLRPLSACIALKTLWLPNTYETADYAYLAAKLPRAACARFNAFERLEPPLGSKNVMVTGKRKPFLSLPQDAAKLAKYEAAFDALKSAAQGD